MCYLRIKKRKERQSRFADRKVVPDDQLAREIHAGAEDLNFDRVLSTLRELAQKLQMPVGALRADDLMSDLIGQDFFAGDAMLDIEQRLSREANLPLELTIKRVVLILAK